MIESTVEAFPEGSAIIIYVMFFAESANAFCNSREMRMRHSREEMMFDLKIEVASEPVVKQTRGAISGIFDRTGEPISLGEWFYSGFVAMIEGKDEIEQARTHYIAKKLHYEVFRKGQRSGAHQEDADHVMRVHPSYFCPITSAHTEPEMGSSVMEKDQGEERDEIEILISQHVRISFLCSLFVEGQNGKSSNVIIMF